MGVSDQKSCHKDDGSTCWECCCGWLAQDHSLGATNVSLSANSLSAAAPQVEDTKVSGVDLSSGRSNGSQTSLLGAESHECGSCSWIVNPNSCHNNDGSPCWEHCCKPKHCTRPGKATTDCDCGWVSDQGSCGKDDGSTCWECCCGWSAQDHSLGATNASLSAIAAPVTNAVAEVSGGRTRSIDLSLGRSNASQTSSLGAENLGCGSCSWIVQPNACHNNDGSACWEACCKPKSGNCDCDCGWVSDHHGCGTDDGSCCWKLCCGWER